MGRGDVVEGEGACKMDAEASVVHEVGQRLECDMVGLHHDPREANAGLLCLGCQVPVHRIGRRHQHAAGAQGRQRALTVVAADQIQDDVEIADLSREVHGSVVEYFVGPEVPGVPADPPGGFKDGAGRVKLLKDGRPEPGFGWGVGTSVAPPGLGENAARRVA